MPRKKRPKRLYGSAAESFLISKGEAKIRQAERHLLNRLCRNSEGCWEWSSWVVKEYGMSYPMGETGIKSHRLSYILYCGEIPDGYSVLHKCDNTLCCKPDHLFVGTHQDNMADRLLKCRQARGERNGSATLSESQVKGIWFATRSSKKYKEIAKTLRVNKSTVRSIAIGKTWKSVTSKLGTPEDLEKYLNSVTVT